MAACLGVGVVECHGFQWVLRVVVSWLSLIIDGGVSWFMGGHGWW